jgi:prepilin-type N-terminal cleavage/methylation domain-containing protein
MRITSCRRAFTLIELLVVIAIIGVLASMLIPAINTAKAVATGMDCGSRQRQTALALIAYASDNRGWLPYREGMDCSGANIVHASYRRATVALYQGEYLPSSYAISFEPGWACAHGWSAWSNSVVMRSYRNPSACPGQQPVDPVTKVRIQPKDWQFQMRWFFDSGKLPGVSEQTSAAGGSMRLVNANQSMPLLGDAVRLNSPANSGGYWWNWSPVPGEYSVTPPNSTNFLLRNHRDRAVVSFPDGRCATLAQGQMRENNVLHSVTQP